MPAGQRVSNRIKLNLAYCTPHASLKTIFERRIYLRWVRPPCTSFPNASIEHSIIQATTPLYMPLKCSLLRDVISEVAGNMLRFEAALPYSTSLHASITWLEPTTQSVNVFERL